MLTVRVQNAGNTVTLSCRGGIVRGEETTLLCVAAHQSAKQLVIDLRQVDRIDAAGIGALLALQAAGIYLKLMNPTEHVRGTLRVTGMGSIFEIGESRLVDEPPDLPDAVPATLTPCPQL
jgi:anti-anti-sigma factor